MTRQVISSEFPKSLRGAGDLVALGEVLKVYKKHKNRKILTYNQIPKTLQKLTWNTWWCIDWSFKKIEGSFCFERSKLNYDKPITDRPTFEFDQELDQ